MAKIDYLASKMNINGASISADVVGGGEPELVTNDVYGAMALGNLSPNAYIFGSAFINKDGYMIGESMRIGTMAIDKLCNQENWSVVKPFQHQVNQWVIEGRISKAEADIEKVRLGEVLKFNLAKLAVNDILQNHLCLPCNGTGEINGRKHRACDGNGTTTLPETQKAKYCGIHYSTWKQTWQFRFKLIETLFIGWSNEFLEHLERKV